MVVEGCDLVAPFSSELEYLTVGVFVALGELILLIGLEVIDRFCFGSSGFSHCFLFVSHGFELGHLIVIDVLYTICIALFIMVTTHRGIL